MQHTWKSPDATLCIEFLAKFNTWILGICLNICVGTALSLLSDKYRTFIEFILMKASSGSVLVIQKQVNHYWFEIFMMVFYLLKGHVTYLHELICIVILERLNIKFLISRENIYLYLRILFQLYHGKTL